MVTNKDMQLFMENLKMKRKRTKNIDLREPGFEPQIFSNFPANDLNLRKARSNQNKLLKEIGLYISINVHALAVSMFHKYFM